MQIDPILSGNLKELLRKLPAFADLSLDELANMGSIRELENEEILFRRTTPCEFYYLLLTGRARLSIPTTVHNTGKVILMAKPGDGLNTPSLFLDPAQNLWTCQSQGPCRVGLFPISGFFEVLKASPDLRQVLLADISWKLMHLMRFKTGFLAKCAASRVMEYLLELVPNHHVRDDAIVVLPTQKQVMAAKLLLEPATLSRILNQLQQRGLIAVRHRQVKIPSLRTFRDQLEDWDQRTNRCLTTRYQDAAELITSRC